MSVSAAHAVAILGMFFISTTFSVGDEIADSMPASVLMAIRFGGAVILFAPFIMWRYGIKWPGLSGLGRYALLSVFSGIFFWTMFEGLKTTDSLNSGAISTIVPGFTGIYGALLMRERLGRYRWAAMVIGLVGALWVIFRGDPARLVALELSEGDAIFFGGCISMGLYAALIPKLHRGEPVAVMSFWFLLITTLGFLALANTELARIDWGAVEPGVWGGLAWLVVGPTLLTFFMIQVTSIAIGSTRVQAYSYLIPAFVLVIDWASGRGLPSAMTIPGIAIVLLATLVIQRGAITEGAARS